MLRLTLSLSLLLAATASARPETQPELLARYVAARDQSSLVSSEMKPWHMVATFELYNAAGDKKEQGTFEEWWASPTHWRVDFTSPSFSHDRLRNADQTYVNIQADTPYFLTKLWGNLVGPLPHFGRVNPIFKEQKRTLDKHVYDCLTTDFNPEHTTSDPAFLPEYCFDHGGTDLRFVNTHAGMEAVLFNHPGHFGNMNVALDLTIVEGQRTALHASVTTLTSMSPDDPHLTVPAAFQLIDHSTRPLQLSSPPKKVSGPSVVRPPSATFTKGGSALLSVEIAENGHVTAVEPIFSTDPSSERAAIEAVQQWVFQPYTIDGKAKRVITPIRFQF